MLAGYDVGADSRTGMVHGPRAMAALSWNRFALGLGGGLDLSGRSLARTREEIVTGFGRVTIEVRIPFDRLMLRVGAGARAGWLSQSLAEVSGPITHNGAFLLGPEAFATLRTDLGRSFFVDVGVNGNASFLREEDKTRGVLGGAGSVALGARF